MATGLVKGVKPTYLGEDTTFSDYSKWQSTMFYCLNKDPIWQPFLKPAIAENKDTSWAKLTSKNVTRGFEDGDPVTKADKAQNLNSMLEYIAQHVPECLNHEIVYESTCMKSVWKTIRQYFNIQENEARFLTLSSIKWEGRGKERPERLYRRILSHLTDNLLKAEGSLKHNGIVPSENEDFSPTVERLAVHRWLELIDPRMPGLVARLFATDLMVYSLTDLQPMIASAMDSFLDQLDSEDMHLASAAHINELTVSGEGSDEDIQAAHVTSRSKFFNKAAQRRPANSSKPRTSQPRQQCNLCLGWGRPAWGHTLATCNFVSDGEKREISRKSAKSFRVNTEVDRSHQPEDDYDSPI